MHCTQLLRRGRRAQAQEIVKAHQLRIRVWESSDVVDSVLALYDKLDEDIRSRLPLKRVWMLADPEV